MLQAPPVLTGLRAVREAEGFTIAELAEIVGVSERMMRRIETDREYARRMKTTTAVRIAYAIGGSLADLVTVLDLPLTGRHRTDDHLRSCRQWPGAGAKWLEIRELRKEHDDLD